VRVVFSSGEEEEEDEELWRAERQRWWRLRESFAMRAACLRPLLPASPKESVARCANSAASAYRRCFRATLAERSNSEPLDLSIFQASLPHTAVLPLACPPCVGGSLAGGSIFTRARHAVTKFTELNSPCLSLISLHSIAESAASRAMMISLLSLAAFESSCPLAFHSRAPLANPLPCKFPPTATLPPE